jgi:xanthine dehydrogenase YagR molybdenum-binding subunit
MTMGLSMALHEHSVIDPRFGHVVNHNLAEYLIATSADVGSIEAYWLDEDDPYVNPMGHGRRRPARRVALLPPAENA